MRHEAQSLSSFANDSCSVPLVELVAGVPTNVARFGFGGTSWHASRRYTQRQGTIEHRKPLNLLRAAVTNTQNPVVLGHKSMSLE